MTTAQCLYNHHFVCFILKQFLYLYIVYFRPPDNSDGKPNIRLIHLPPKARGEGICFAWKQAQTVAEIPDKTDELNIKPKEEISLALTGHFEKDTTTAKPVEVTTTTTPAAESTTVPVTTESWLDTTEYFDPDDPLYIPSEFYDFGDISLNDSPVKHSSGSKSKQGAKRKFVYKVGDKVLSRVDQQEQETSQYQGCWAIDQVLIVNLAHPPSMLQDDFDPVDPSDWLVFPGAHFKVTFIP